MTGKSQESLVRQGLIAAFAAQALWGGLPLYLRLVSFADVREILAQRILWSIPAALVGVAVSSGLAAGMAHIRTALNPKMIATLAASALFVFGNWSAYVWAVTHDRLIEAAFAYFVAPLVQVAVGVVFFGERAGPGQVAAFALALVGVAVQGFALGAPPWLAACMCGTWCAYAILRKRAVVPASVGLLIETSALLPVAIGLLWWTAQTTPLLFPQSAHNAVLLALVGPATALPLTLFAFGARRISFISLGLLQYISPSMQFGLGIAFGEPLSATRLASFVLIWAGLALFTGESLLRERARVAARSPAASPTPPADTPEPAQTPPPRS